MKSMAKSTIVRLLVSVSFIAFSVSSITYLEHASETGLFRLSTPEIIAKSFLSALLIYYGTLVCFKRVSGPAATMGVLLMIGSLFWYRRLGADLGHWEWQLILTLIVALPVIAGETAAAWIKASSPRVTSALGKRQSLAYIAGHEQIDPHHRRRDGRVGSRLAGNQLGRSGGHSRNAPQGWHIRPSDRKPG